MKSRKLFLLLLISVLFPSLNALSPEESTKIGMKIWWNEGRQQKEKLTWWNEREEFASLGIGHFLWYPSTTPQVYQQSFPELLSFFIEQGIVFPEWLQKGLLEGCPWKTREEFFSQINSPQMNELRELLFSTIDIQAQFIVKRFSERFNSIIESYSNEKARAHLQRQLQRLEATPNGMYALIDYLNFKGEGLNQKEEYSGHRWGLLQVLEAMKGDEKGVLAIQEFVLCAQKILEARVACAPKHKQEEKWLPGWKARLETYLVKL